VEVALRRCRLERRRRRSRKRRYGSIGRRGGSVRGSSFVEAIRYYSALFDSLPRWTRATGASYSEDSPERHAVEQQLLSREIRNPLAVGGPVPTGDVKFDGWHSPGSTRPRSPLASLLAAARHVPLCLLTASAWRPIQMPSWH
jgi:hypothetical protein